MATTASTSTAWHGWLAVLRRWPRTYAYLRGLRRAVPEGAAWLFKNLIPARLPWGPPRGVFSALELLDRGALPGRVIYRSQDVPPADPASLRVRCGLGQHGHQPFACFWTRHRKARLVGRELLLVDDQRRICLESAYNAHSLSADPDRLHFIRGRPVRLEGPWTSIRSRWSNGFYHWINDALPRLAVLPELPSDVRVIVPAALAPYQIETLGWLGLEGRFRPTPEKHVAVDDFYFASPTAMTGCYNPFAARFLREQFLPRADRAWDAPKRFYVQRVGVSRGIVHEDEVVELFRERGWAIIDTARLSMARQVQLFAGAEEICAFHGAALSNLLWCKPGTRVYEFCASTHLNGCFEGIAEALALRYRYTVFPADTAYQARVDLAELKRLLEA